MNIPIEELNEEAYSKVKKLIVTKQLSPGETITSEQLSYSLGIQQSPLINALQKLEAETLLVSMPYGGVTVRALNTSEILQIFDCRIALEVMATRNFAVNAPQEKIDDLRNLLVPFEKGPINSHVFTKIDMHFHNHIVKYAGNYLLYSLFQKGNLVACMELIGLSRPAKEVLQEHLDIVSALHHRNGDMAAVLMKEHLEKSKHTFI